MGVIDWLLDGDPAIRWQVMRDLMGASADDVAGELVRSKQQSDGRWLLDHIYPGRVFFDIEADVGAPSRWITLRAMRVLEWWDNAS